MKLRMRKTALAGIALGALLTMSVLLSLNGASAAGPVPGPPIPSEVRQAALAAGLNALTPALAPEPPNLADFLNAGPAARTATVRLGKALFWDAQAGSDGQSCASCHFKAGADGRTKNQLNPGFRQVPPDDVFSAARSGNAAGPNYTLKPADFPFHALQDPNELSFSNRTVQFDTDDVVSSQGVFGATFNGTSPGQPGDGGLVSPDPVFKVGNPPVNVRHVEPRNTPTVINAVFNFNNFWDGRAQNEFNGASPLGHLDDTARILVLAGGTLQSVQVRIPNGSLASQAVGPPLSDLEMSFAGRKFPDIGRKLLDPTLIPLGTQVVDPNDSVLGPLEAGGGGLATTYTALIQQAFQSKFWSSPALTNGYTQMESNFSLFWGLSIQLYESTLVSDQSPFDRFMRGDDAALTPAQLRGLLVFINTADQQSGIFQGVSRGGCVGCHAGPEFTEASTREVAPAPIEIHRSVVNNNGTLQISPAAAFTDVGFANIGVRPTSEDLGAGGTEMGKPLSFSRQAVEGLPFAPPLPIIGEFGALPPTNNNVVADGTFKIPGLRNVELTGPYFHNGGAATLGQVMSFYRRHGDFSDLNIKDLDPALALIDLAPEDEEPLIQFLLSLTDDRVRLEQAPFDHPQLFVPNGHPGTNATIVQTNPGIPIQAADSFLEVPAVGALGRPDIGLGPLTPFLGVAHVAPPAAPTSLSVTAAQPGRIVLSWTDNSPDEVGFRVQRASTVGFTRDVFEDVLPPNTSNYTDAGGSAGVTFFYRVFAFSESASVASNVVSAAPPAPVEPPAAPGGLDARVMRGPTEIDLTWTDLSDNEASFNIERSDNVGAFVRVGSVGASINVFADTTVIPGSRYSYRVIAANAIGQSVSDAFVVDVASPANAPSNLSLAPVAPGVTKVTWNDTTNNEIGFRVERSIAGDFAIEKMVFLVFNPSFVPGPRPGQPPGVIEFDDPVISPAPLVYRVFAFNDMGDSPPSATAAINAAVSPPAAPTGLTASPSSSTMVVLNWRDNSTTESGFMIQRAPDASFVSGLAEMHAAINVTTFNDITASPGTEYFYRVIAVSPSGMSAASNTARVTTPASGSSAPPPTAPPPAPAPAPGPAPAPSPVPSSGGGGSAGGGGGGGIAAASKPVALDGLVSPTGLSEDAGGRVLADAQAKTAHDDVVLNIAAGTLVTHEDGRPAISLSAAPVASPSPPPAGAVIVSDFDLGPDGVRFDPPIGLTMLFDKARVPSGVPVDQVYIAYRNGDQWVKMDSSASPGAGSVSTVTGHFTEFAVISPASSPVPAASLPSPAASGRSDLPAATPATPAPAPAPAAPVNLTATLTAPNAVTLRWDAQSHNENTFMIERSTDGGFSFMSGETEFHAPADVTVFVDTTVAAGNTYYYRVMASHGVGTSAPSNIASVTVPPQAASSTSPSGEEQSVAVVAPDSAVRPAPGTHRIVYLARVLGMAGAAVLIIVATVVLISRRKQEKA